jgi:hypothetical protein
MAASQAKVDATTAKMRRAVETADLDMFLETLAPKVLLRSPISALAEFSGKDQLRTLMEGVFETITDIHYYEELGDERARALFYRGRVGATEVEEASLLRFDSDGLITEFVLWFRPLPGLTAVAAGLGPKLSRRNGRFAHAVVTLGGRLLAVVTRLADPLLVRLALPRHPPPS